MAFTTLCCKNRWLEGAWRGLWLIGLLWMAGFAQAQNATEISRFQVERADDEVVASAQVLFELPPAVEDALLKGIPLFFVAEVELMRERWYWYDKKVAGVARHMRLAYQPLTRRWRVNLASGSGQDIALGLELNQSFDTLAQALSAIKRISRWKLANVAELETGTRYRVEMRFRLDLTQLPRPFQIGALGQSDWDLAATAITSLALSSAK